MSWLAFWIMMGKYDKMQVKILWPESGQGLEHSKKESKKLNMKRVTKLLKEKKNRNLTRCWYIKLSASSLDAWP